MAYHGDLAGNLGYLMAKTEDHRTLADASAEATQSSLPDSSGGVTLEVPSTRALATSRITQATASQPPRKYLSTLSSWHAISSCGSNMRLVMFNSRPASLAASSNTSAVRTRDSLDGSSMETRSPRAVKIPVGTAKRERPPFCPSQQWLVAQGLIDGASDGVRHKGDPTSKSALATERRLPDKENCALWLTGLPGDITYALIFDWLEEENAGGVWALHIKLPKDRFETSAARLVFFEQENAQKLFDATKKPHKPFLDNNKVDVKFNREGNRERYDVKARVVEIERPVEMMTWSFWKGYFDQGIIYDPDRWLSLPCFFEGKAKMEIRFARVNGQTQTAIQKIQKDEGMDHIVQAYCKVDPCGGN
ncbi:hypothetical protein BDZ45DRAFT_134823 [Acephala macrosclerotiorum]|nr:hypothetical protein BDZ45DRAFT_134823 [Acephala macrosclerotiorum]